MDTTLEAVEELRRRVKEEHIKTWRRRGRACALHDAMTVGDAGLDLSTGPLGAVHRVNGVGKTTTIGKIGSQLRAERKGALLCRRHLPCRRCRPADRSGRPGRAWTSSKQYGGRTPPPWSLTPHPPPRPEHRRGLVDTAGRLHNKQNLMNELNKISRVVDRELPGCDQETLLVLDATTGQNG